MSVEPVYMMAFTPHPHDAEAGIGGTTARWTKEGKDVVYVVCTNGDKGTSNPNMKAEELAKIREKEQLAAAELLGVREVIFLRHPDLGLEDTSEFRKEIVRLILTYRPEIVSTRCPCNSRYVSNRDHRICGRAVMDAVWPYAMATNFYPDLLEEGLKIHKVKEMLLWNPEQPNYRLDITDTYDKKVAALRCHESQIQDWADDLGSWEEAEKGFFEMTENQFIAAAEGTEWKYAEAFARFRIPPRL